MQTKKKLKLRPWVKVSMMFIFGVFVVSQIFSIMGASASSEEPETIVIHGVVSLKLNGEVHLSVLEGEHYDKTKDISLKQKKEYDYLEIVTVVIKGNKIVNDYLTSGEELKEVEKEHKSTIIMFRQNIIDSIYE